MLFSKAVILLATASGLQLAQAKPGLLGNVLGSVGSAVDSTVDNTVSAVGTVVNNTVGVLTGTETVESDLNATVNAVGTIIDTVAGEVNNVTSALGLAQINSDILSSGNALINLDVIADVLGTGDCTSYSSATVVGIEAVVNVANLASICACIDIGGTLPSGTSTCPDCPAHASAICSDALCGCQCNTGYYATVVNGTNYCSETSNCVSPNILTSSNSTGQSTCTCARGYIDDLLGGCISACLWLGLTPIVVSNANDVQLAVQETTEALKNMFDASSPESSDGPASFELFAAHYTPQLVEALILNADSSKARMGEIAVFILLGSLVRWAPSWHRYFRESAKGRQHLRDLIVVFCTVVYPALPTNVDNDFAPFQFAFLLLKIFQDTAVTLPSFGASFVSAIPDAIDCLNNARDHYELLVEIEPEARPRIDKVVPFNEMIRRFERMKTSEGFKASQEEAQRTREELGRIVKSDAFLAGKEGFDSGLRRDYEDTVARKPPYSTCNLSRCLVNNEDALKVCSKQISPLVYLSEPASPSAATTVGDDPSIVVMFGWMEANIKHLQKYISAYQLLVGRLSSAEVPEPTILTLQYLQYPATTVILIRSFQKTFFKSPAAQLKQLKPAHTLLSAKLPPNPRSGKESRVLVHAFSNGGAQSLQYLNKLFAGEGLAEGEAKPLLEGATSGGLPARVVVLDSCPGKESLSSAVAAFTAPFQKSLLYWPVAAALTVVYGWLKLVALITRKPPHLTLIGQYLNTSLPQVPRLYLYSNGDKLINDADVEEHAAEAKQRGVEVRLEKFDKTGHVNHVAGEANREKYWKAIRETWEKAGKEA
ncbi:indole-diterpene biosynthesis protein PaxU [Pseudohyphozyma bogoriensis]|nr:indole-diterpene biosynthesis protein PaxU [Pseudohyphozyma bogoriensis]